MPQVIINMIAVRMAVARSGFTFFKPALANTAVSAANIADKSAYNNHVGMLLICRQNSLSVLKPNNFPFCQSLYSLFRFFSLRSVISLESRLLRLGFPALTQAVYQKFAVAAIAFLNCRS